MVPVHTKPEDSEKELDELYDVFQNVCQKWATDVRRRIRLFYCSNVMAAVFAVCDCRVSPERDDPGRL